MAIFGDSSISTLGGMCILQVLGAVSYKVIVGLNFLLTDYFLLVCQFLWAVH